MRPVGMHVGKAGIQRAADRLSDLGGVRENCLHPRVRLERLAVHDADRGKLAG